MQLLSTTEPQTFHGATTASDPKSAAYFFLSSSQKYLTLYIRVQQQTAAQAFKYSVYLFVSWMYSDERRDWPGSRIVLILSMWGWQKVAAFYLLSITERKTRCTTKQGCKMPQKPGLCGDKCEGATADWGSRRHALLAPPLWTCQRFTGQ